MSIDPGVIAWLIAAEALYLRAIRILDTRGVVVGRGQQACWHTNLLTS